MNIQEATKIATKKMSLSESTVERKIYQLIHDYDLSYNQVKLIFEVVDEKLIDHIQNTEISKSKKPLDLTRGQENKQFVKIKNQESANESAHRLLKSVEQHCK
ncbi:hypothetical protein I6D83_08995 [Staphylococcus aureus]|uniref:hypothetical protein n=1 Tax=Staphylococcus aureus TaxID=1280 RepID=UPI0018CB4336|nr:hypothetical protein [Staphylococcus aureus]MBH4881713.1 hypothetical protein [Staphylococcus aureus]MBH4895553.1 hypothetical protein [Staphylococcus aureus]MBH4900222.1 hypothetical protein [Staphylococcus aureus]MBH4918199.1 hypothetical protein [Staphylococcus aureus]MBH4921086.1 hypothetical protein [Staphylococcus aureus]